MSHNQHTLTVETLKRNIRKYNPDLSKYHVIKEQLQPLSEDIFQTRSLIRIWVKNIENEVMLQYSYQITRQSQLDEFYKQFIYRYNHKQLMSTKYINVDKTQYFWKVKIYYEVSIASLNQFEKIPQKDAIYLTKQLFEGFNQLKKKYGSFKVMDYMIKFNSNKQVKVWICDEVFYEKSLIQQEEQLMIQDILNIIDKKVLFYDSYKFQSVGYREFNRQIFQNFKKMRHTNFNSSIDLLDRTIQNNGIRFNQWMTVLDHFTIQQMLDTETFSKQIKTFKHLVENQQRNNLPLYSRQFQTPSKCMPTQKLPRKGKLSLTKKDKVIVSGCSETAASSFFSGVQNQNSKKPKRSNSYSQIKLGGYRSNNQSLMVVYPSIPNQMINQQSSIQYYPNHQSTITIQKAYSHQKNEFTQINLNQKPPIPVLLKYQTKESSSKQKCSPKKYLQISKNINPFSQEQKTVHSDNKTQNIQKKTIKKGIFQQIPNQSLTRFQNEQPMSTNPSNYSTFQKFYPPRYEVLNQSYEETVPQIIVHGPSHFIDHEINANSELYNLSYEANAADNFHPKFDQNTNQSLFTDPQLLQYIKKKCQPSYRSDRIKQNQVQQRPKNVGFQGKKMQKIQQNYFDNVNISESLDVNLTENIPPLNRFGQCYKIQDFSQIPEQSDYQQDTENVSFIPIKLKSNELLPFNCRNYQYSPSKEQPGTFRRGHEQSMVVQYQKFYDDTNRQNTSPFKILNTNRLSPEINRFQQRISYEIPRPSINYIYSKDNLNNVEMIKNMRRHSSPSPMTKIILNQIDMNKPSINPLLQQDLEKVRNNRKVY